MTDTQLQNLIAALSANTKAIETVLARDPAREYAYTEGLVGAKENFMPCPKFEAGYLRDRDADAQNFFRTSASIVPQFWRLRATYLLNGLFTDLTFTSLALIVEFDKRPDFISPVRTFVLPKIHTEPTSWTANTGRLVFDFDRTFPVRHRHMRVCCTILGQQTDTTNIGTFKAAAFGMIAASVVWECFGE